MTAGASRAELTITLQPALAPSPQPRPAPTGRALPPVVDQEGQSWMPIVGQNCTPIDTTESGGYRRDYLRALAQRVEVDAQELRIMGSKSVLLRTLVAISSVKTAGFGVPSSVPRWRATEDSNSWSMGNFCSPSADGSLTSRLDSVH